MPTGATDDELIFEEQVRLKEVETEKAD
jgi:hypothetical protein